MMDLRGQRLTSTPTLQDTRPLLYTELPPLLQAQGPATTDRMQEFGLVWREHLPSGFIFLGLENSELEDHNRWVLMVNPDVEELWYGVQPEGVPHERSIVKAGLRLRSATTKETFIMEYLQQLAANYDNLAEPTERLGLVRPPISVMVAYSRVAPEIGFEKAASLFRYDLRYLHGILHHYDTWALANPEYADMPRDIVMRLHGLGFYHQYRYM